MAGTNDVEYLNQSGLPSLIDGALGQLLRHRPDSAKSAFCAIATSLTSSPNKPKLTYFDGPGRAELTRLCFVIGGVPFDDVRITFEEFNRRKAAGDIPFGSLPSLEVDGKQYTQSMALAKYAACRSGLYPSNIEDQILVDQTLATLEADIWAKLPPGSQGSMRQIRKMWACEQVPKLLGPLEKAASSNVSGFIVGGSRTVADVAVGGLLWAVERGDFDHLSLDDFPYPALRKLMDALRALPPVIEWVADTTKRR